VHELSQKLETIPFNRPFITGKEIDYISDAHVRGKLSGDGHYTALCSRWLESQTGAKRALLTHSCTAALEMAAILIDLKVGDEVIMPSYTFVSTANAFVLRGGVPVFVDIKIEDQNIDESKIEAAITPKTKAIVVVHYAGVACEMDTIMEIADRHGIVVVEDAAQAIFSFYKGKPLGTIGQLGCFSFHETKNVISGEGGALLVNDENLIERSEIIREKGTDRSRFFRGQVDKYTWQDLGSSYLPSEINAAFLWAQLQEGESITSARRKLWSIYFDTISSYDHVASSISLPISGEKGNAHMFQILLKTPREREKVSRLLSEKYIMAVSHYVPLHSSPKGVLVGRSDPGGLPVTDSVSSRILRLPLYPDLGVEQDRVIDALEFATR
jgi:dTDP-4-amino-4,6-dideoxygalactose transaminase